MKVLYLKDNYDILLKITVPDVAYLKRIKRANRFFVYTKNTPPLSKKIDKLRYACSRMFTGPYAGFFHQGAVAYMPKVTNIRRIINNILKIINIVFSRGAIALPAVYGSECLGL